MLSAISKVKLSSRVPNIGWSSITVNFISQLKYVSRIFTVKVLCCMIETENTDIFTLKRDYKQNTKSNLSLLCKKLAQVKINKQKFFLYLIEHYKHRQ